MRINHLRKRFPKKYKVMRQFILLFLFIAFVTAADDALIETETGPKSSADLIKPDAAAIDKIPMGAAVGTTVVKDDAKAGAIAEEVLKAKTEDKSVKSSESKESKEESEGAKVVAVPKETVAIAHKKPGEEAEVAAATKADIKVVEPEPARVKRDKEAESVLEEGAVIDVGAIGTKEAVAQSKAIANKSKSSESSESKEDHKVEEKEEVETADTKKVLIAKAVPKETVVVAHKKAGEEAEVASVTKVGIKPVAVATVPVPAEATRVKREKEAESVLTEGAVIDVGAVGNKAAVAESKAIADKSKSSESNESKEDQKDKEVEAVKVSKVPTEKIAVAHKEAGDDEVEIATATKASIVAEKIQKSRARRFA
uniref:Uncharacterized protein n=1 Tax=Panagrolaimus superbus TaxID=310955 RepID=A0A914YS86_9BILA